MTDACSQVLVGHPADSRSDLLCPGTRTVRTLSASPDCSSKADLPRTGIFAEYERARTSLARRLTDLADCFDSNSVFLSGNPLLYQTAYSGFVQYQTARDMDSRTMRMTPVVQAIPMVDHRHKAIAHPMALATEGDLDKVEYVRHRWQYWSNSVYAGKISTKPSVCMG